LYVLSTVIQAALQGYVLFRWGADLEHYFPVYWGGEIFLDILMFLVMASLTMRALEGSPMRDKVLRFLGVVFIVIVAVPFIAFEGGMKDTKWNDSTSQLLSFGAAVANVVLWGAMLTKKPRDKQMMIVTIGLGVALASSAATFGMRSFTNPDTLGRTFADYAHRVLQVGSALILCWAFWPKRKASTPAPV
jgi:hypothetical protein